MRENYLGYLLLTLGVLIIILSALGVYLVFSGKVQAFNVFSLPPITLDLSGLMEAESSNIELPTQANLETELVKEDILNKPMNLAAHLLFMTFLSSVGFKIAQLGVLLLRPIKVNLKGEKVVAKFPKLTQDTST
jgi:hypothetical protein